MHHLISSIKSHKLVDYRVTTIDYLLYTGHFAYAHSESFLATPLEIKAEVQILRRRQKPGASYTDKKIFIARLTMIIAPATFTHFTCLISPRPTSAPSKYRPPRFNIYMAVSHDAWHTDELRASSDIFIDFE